MSFDSRDTDFILAADVDGDGDSDVPNLRNVDGDDAAQVLTSTDGTLEADDAQPIGRGEVSYHRAAWMIGDVEDDSADELMIPMATPIPP